MKKRLFSVFLALCMIFSLFSLSGCGGETAEEEPTVSRGQWIQMLGDAFGLEPQSQDPHYSDVPANSEYFSPIQAAAEWNILSVYNTTKFEPEKPVTKEEVAVTAAIAAGFSFDESDLDKKGNYESDRAIAFSQKYAIIEDTDHLDSTMYLTECQQCVDAAINAYLVAEQEEKTIAVFDENVFDLTQDTLETTVLSDNRLSYPGKVLQNANGETVAQITTDSGVMEIKEGSVLISTPTIEYPAGIGYKITEISQSGDQVVFETTVPELSDVYEELDVHTTVSYTEGNIIWEDGVVAKPVASAQGVSASDGGYYISLLSYEKDEAVIQKLAGGNNSSTHTFEFGSGSFEKNSTKNISLGSGEEADAFANSSFSYDKTPSIDDFNGSTSSWTEDLTVETKYSGGYLITGSIEINALNVTPNVEYKRSKILNIPYGIQSASIQVDSSIVSTLTMEGNLSGSVKIATVPIPIPAVPGLSVTVDLYLYADASGMLQVRAELGSSAKVEYSERGGLKRAAESHATADIDAAIEIDFGADLMASLDAVGLIKIMDAGVEAGGLLEASAHVGGNCQVSSEDGQVKTTYQEAMNIKADLYVPIIKVHVGGADSLMGKIGLSNEWTVISKKDAYDINIVDYEWVFWEETVFGENTRENILDDDGDRIDLKTYSVTLQGESVQLELDSDGNEMPEVSWTSENPEIATVDSDGVVSPVSQGVTTIIVSLKSNPSVQSSCTVAVEELGENNWEFLP